MFEVSNESPATAGSTTWQTNIISYVKTYEKTTYGSHHPIGFTTQHVPGESDSTLYNSAADWVSPVTTLPPAATGQCPVVTGNGGAANPSSPNCKVVINDTDHSYGWPTMQGDGATGQTKWAWENFMLGNGVAFMDPYLVLWTTRNNCTGAPVGGDAYVCSGLDPQWNQLRSAMADLTTYAKKIDLKNMTPQYTLFGSGFGLASTSAPVSYLMFSPNGSAAETITTVAGTYTVEVFDTSAHAIVSITPNVSIGTSYTFNPPGSHNYVVWIH
jgi:hypothetical protein